MEKHQKFHAYADGSCIGNPGPGGWGVVIVSPGGETREFSGFGGVRTTNQRMEIAAAVEALRRIDRGAQVVLRSDSRYVVSTMTLGWKRRKNFDLWKLLDEQARNHQVTFQWVRGHGADPLNNRADELAQAAARGRRVPESPVEGPVESERVSASSAATAIRRLLRPGEAILKCARCGRAFVGSKGKEKYCALVRCQVRARHSDP